MQYITENENIHKNMVYLTNFVMYDDFKLYPGL